MMPFAEERQEHLQKVDTKGLDVQLINNTKRHNVWVRNVWIRPRIYTFNDISEEGNLSDEGPGLIMLSKKNKVH